MQSILVIGSLLGILSCLLLIAFPVLVGNGNKLTTYLFSFFAVALFLLLAKPFFSVFTDELHNHLFTIHLIGLILLGPAYFLFVQSHVERGQFFSKKIYLLLVPALLLIASWFFLDHLQTHYKAWNVYHRLVMLHFISFLTYALFKVDRWKAGSTKVKRQFHLFSSFLLALWFAALLHEISGLRYLEGTLAFSFVVYLGVHIIINKGLVIEEASGKYQKTGLKESERLRILHQLEELMTVEKIYRDNTISAGKIAKCMNTSIHSLSQVINEGYQHTFFELIRTHRIEEAKELLGKQPERKISDIAYQVGYNSLSAFNTAFKKQNGLTPTQFRNEKAQ